MESKIESKIEIEDVYVGYYSDFNKITGCTVLVFPEGAICAAAFMGGATGTRNFDSLYLDRNITRIYGILITGGSAFGLQAAEGVVQFFKENGIGLKIEHLVIPVVPTAVIFDLFIGTPEPPRPEDAYNACSRMGIIVSNGSFGAGTGAVVGKLFTARYGTKGGQGYSEIEVYKGVRVGCLSVVNAFGDIVKNGKIVAGARSAVTGEFVDTSATMMEGVLRNIPDITGQNTTVSVVITDAYLNKTQAYRIALMAASGMAKVISPVWTVYDGDIVVVASVGDKKIDITALGIAASKVVEDSILKAVKYARSLGEIPSAAQLGTI